MIWSLVATLILLAIKLWAGPAILAAIPKPYGEFIVEGFAIAFIVAIALVLDQIIRRFYWHGHLKKRLGRDTPNLIQDIVTIALVLVALSIGLSTQAGLSMTGIVTASGATAVILGIALQAVIQDLFSGLAINLDNSYAIGDYLTVFSDQVPEPIYGQVISITWRSTFLRMHTGCVVTVPNHVSTTNPVMNHSRTLEGCRLCVQIPMDNRYPAHRVAELLLGEAYKVVNREGFSRSKAPYVRLNRLGSDDLVFDVHFYAFPDKMEPEESRATMLRSLVDAIQHYRLPLAVSQIEVSERPDLDEPGEEEERQAISRARLFRDILDPDQIELLVKHTNPASVEAGKVLMQQGDQASSMFIILQGAASISVKQREGEFKEVAISAAGDVAGEMSLMTGSPRSATVTALTSMRVLEITKEAMTELLKNSPELLERFSVILAKRQAELDEVANRPVRREALQRDLLTRMTDFFSRAFS
jgi:small-conductance mechanosensitive channel/CRP-like cAMP-binding protein